METTHREDVTLVAWYRSLHAPRTGGAYDSHHRTAGIAGCTRRRRGVAARGACAAERTDAAASYIDERRRGRPGDPSASHGHSTGAFKIWMVRGPQCRDRLPLCVGERRAGTVARQGF